MTLTLSNNTLTRYATADGYATVTPIPLDGDLAALVQSLLAWLSSTLAPSETLADVVLEQAGSVTLEDETTRETLSAAVSVTAPQGSRTFVASSESLPSLLRDGLLAAWAAIGS